MLLTLIVFFTNLFSSSNLASLSSARPFSALPPPSSSPMAASICFQTAAEEESLILAFAIFVTCDVFNNIGWVKRETSQAVTVSSAWAWPVGEDRGHDLMMGAIIFMDIF